MDSDLDGTSNTISKTLEPITNYSPEQKVDEHFHDKQEEDATDHLSKQENDEEFNVKDSSMQMNVNLNIKQEKWASEEENTINQLDKSKSDFDDKENSVDVKHNLVSNINQDTASETPTDHFNNSEDNTFTTMLRTENISANLKQETIMKHFNNSGIQKSKSLKELKHEAILEDPILHVKQDKGDDKDKPTDNFNSHESHQSKSLTNLKNEQDIKDLIQFSDEESNQSEPSSLLKTEDIYMTYLMHLELLEENSITTEDEITTDFISNLESLETKSLTLEEEDLYVNEDLLQPDFNPLVTIDEVEDSHEIKSLTYSKIEETENKEDLTQLDFKQDTKQENVDIKNENKEGCNQENKSSTSPEIEEIENYEDLLQLDLQHDIKQENVDTKNENEEEETHENTSSTDPTIEEIENKEDLMQLDFTQDLQEENAEKENPENKSSTDLKQDLTQLDEYDDALCSKTSSGQDLHTRTIGADDRPIINEQTAEQSSSTKYKSQQRWFQNIIQTQKDLYEAKRMRMMRTFEIKMQLMDLKKQFLVQKLKYAKEEQELKMMLDAALRKKVEAEKELAQRKKE